jgi:hypothetical protein
MYLGLGLSADFYGREVTTAISVSLSWGPVHFDRFALFQFFSLDRKHFATSKFSHKNFFEHKLPLLCLLRII